MFDIFKTIVNSGKLLSNLTCNADVVKEVFIEFRDEAIISGHEHTETGQVSRFTLHPMLTFIFLWWVYCIVTIIINECDMLNDARHEKELVEF